MDELGVCNEEQLVVFELAGEAYGVQIALVHEIIRVPAITKVPRVPEFVEGVINLRGRVIPVVDLGRRLGLAATRPAGAGRIVVVDTGQQAIGLMVDGVSEVLTVQASMVEPPSPVVTTVGNEYLRGIAKVGERLIILVNMNEVLSLEERKELLDVA